MGVWDSLKSFGRGVLGGLSKVGTGILGGLTKARDWVKEKYGKLKDIPVIGSVAEKLASTGIPLLEGLSLKDVAGKVSDAIDLGQDLKSAIGSRDIGKGAEALKGLRRIGRDPFKPIGIKGMD